jgi:hypothetical protein
MNANDISEEEMRKVYREAGLTVKHWDDGERLDWHRALDANGDTMADFATKEECDAFLYGYALGIGKGGRK